MRLARAVVALTAFASPAAHADVAGFDRPRPEITYREDPGPDDDWFGRILIYNRDGSSGNPGTFATAEGEVVVTHDVTPNWPCREAMSQPFATCDDTFTVSDLPTSVTAEPPRVRVAEETEAVIYLYRVHLGF